MRGVSLDVYRLSRLSEYRLLGEVGEHNHQSKFVFAGSLVGETSVYLLDGVDTFDAAIRTVNIKFTLVHVKKSAFELKSVAAYPTGGKCKTCY